MGNLRQSTRQAGRRGARRARVRVHRLAAAPVRSGCLPGRAVRPERLWAKHPPCERSRHRPDEQYHVEPHRGHGVAARASGDRALAGARWLMAAVFFPEQWERLRAAAPLTAADRDLVDAFHRMLYDPDPTVRQRAALEWCLWESATPAWPPTEGLSSRFEDREFALAFARLVTHYVRHNAWLDDGCLLRGAEALSDIPGILVTCRFEATAGGSRLSGTSQVVEPYRPRCRRTAHGRLAHAPGELCRGPRRQSARDVTLPGDIARRRRCSQGRRG